MSQRILAALARPKTLFWVGFIATLIFVSAVIISRRTFNFEIFRYGVLDSWSGQNPYISWDHISESGRELDRYQYPPLFSFLFLPFAILPVWLGAIIWTLLSFCVLFYAMARTKAFRDPAPEGGDKRFAFVFFYTIVVLISSLQATQYNPLNAAFCLLILLLLEEKRYIWAMLIVVVGGLTKVYPGMVALLFLFYPDFWRKPWRILAGIVMVLAGLLLPALFTGFEGLADFTLDWVRWLDGKEPSRYHGITSHLYRLGFHGFLPYTIPILLGGILLPVLKSGALLLAGRLRNDYQFRAGLLGTMMVGMLVWGNATEANTYIIGMLGWLLFYFTKSERTRFDHLCTALLFVVFGILPMDFLCPPSVSKVLLFDIGLGAYTGLLLWLRMFLYTPKPTSNG